MSPTGQSNPNTQPIFYLSNKYGKYRQPFVCVIQSAPSTLNVSFQPVLNPMGCCRYQYSYSREVKKQSCIGTVYQTELLFTQIIYRNTHFHTRSLKYGFQASVNRLFT